MGGWAAEPLPPPPPPPHSARVFARRRQIQYIVSCVQHPVFLSCGGTAGRAPRPPPPPPASLRPPQQNTAGMLARSRRGSKGGGAHCWRARVVRSFPVRRPPRRTRGKHGRKWGTIAGKKRGGGGGGGGVPPFRRPASACPYKCARLCDLLRWESRREEVQDVRGHEPRNTRRAVSSCADLSAKS